MNQFSILRITRSGLVTLVMLVGLLFCNMSTLFNVTKSIFCC